MKLEEAIKILSELHDQCCQIDNIFCTDTTGARCEAVDMAIKALEQPELCNDIEEDVEEALRVLDAIRTSGRLNYGDYSNLFDVISGIGIQKSSNDDKGCSNCIYSGRPTYKSPCSECRDNSQWEMKPISRGHENSTECEDTISRQAAIDALERKLAEPYHTGEDWYVGINCAEAEIYALSSAQPEYEPVKAEDFAKTMSENTIYRFMAWHGEALVLMERYGFVICKKTL